MVMKMKISYLKYENDKNSFKIPEHLGFDVFKIKDLEKTDNKIEELIKHRYDTIIVSNEVASFSQDIIKKYAYSTNINIFITPSKQKEE